jgi:hypothetical protein
MSSLITGLALQLIVKDFVILNLHKTILKFKLEKKYLLQGTNLFDQCMCL